MTQQEQQQFTESLEAALSWIQDVQDRLRANDDTQGPRDALKVRLDESKKIYQSKHEGQMKLADAQMAAQSLLESKDEELHRSTNAKLKELRNMWDETEQSITHCHSRIEWVWLRWSEYLKAYEEFVLWLEKQRCSLDVDVEQQVGAKEKLWQADQQRVLLSDVRGKAAMLERLLEEAATLHSTTQDPSVDSQTQGSLQESYNDIKYRSEERLALLQRISDEHYKYQDYVDKFQAFLLSKTKELTQLMTQDKPKEGKHKAFKALDDSVACEEKTLKCIEVIADGVKANTSPAGAEAVQEEAEELRLGWQRLRQELSEAGEALGYSLDTHILDPHSPDSHSSRSQSQDSHSLDSHSQDSHSLDSHSLVTHSQGSHSQGSHSLDSHSQGSHSLDSHSLDSHSLDSHSLDSHSLDSHSLDSHSLDSHSQDSHSLDSHSLDSHSLGIPNLGSPNLGSPNLGSHSQGSHGLNFHSLGSHGLDFHSQGSLSLGSHSLDTPNLGSPNLGSHSLDFHSQGSHSLDTPNLGSHSKGSHSLSFHSQGSHSLGSHSLDTPNLGSRSPDSHSSRSHSQGSHSLSPPNQGSHSPDSHSSHSQGSHSLSPPNRGSHSPDSHSSRSHSQGSHSLDTPNLGFHNLSLNSPNLHSHSLDSSNLGSHSQGSQSLESSNLVSHTLGSHNSQSHSQDSLNEYTDRSQQLQRDIGSLRELLQGLDDELDHPQRYSYNIEEQIVGRWRNFTDTRTKLEEQESQVENLKAQLNELLKFPVDSRFLSEEVLALDVELQSVKSRATRLCSESESRARSLLQEPLQEYADWSREASEVLETYAGISDFSQVAEPVRRMELLLRDSDDLHDRLCKLEQKDNLLESLFEPDKASDMLVELSDAIRRQELLNDQLLQEKDRLQGLILETKDFDVAYKQLDAKMAAFRKRLEAAEVPQDDIFALQSQSLEINALQTDMKDFMAYLTALGTLVSTSEENKNRLDGLVDDWRELRGLSEVTRLEKTRTMSNHKDSLRLKLGKDFFNKTKKPWWNPEPRSFLKPGLLARVCRVALLLWFLLLALLLLASFLLPFVDESNSCSFTNNFARSFNIMLRYHGPPPT
uniref:Spectrin repeat containing, nuclear envelope family member 3 n=1 Tax=Oryzias latipes TaxID=8090 RepID=A0A3P9MPU4_ORYLA